MRKATVWRFRDTKYDTSKASIYLPPIGGYVRLVRVAGSGRILKDSSSAYIALTVLDRR